MAWKSLFWLRTPHIEIGRPNTLIQMLKIKKWPSLGCKVKVFYNCCDLLCVSWGLSFFFGHFSSVLATIRIYFWIWLCDHDCAGSCCSWTGWVGLEVAQVPWFQNCPRLCHFTWWEGEKGPSLWFSLRSHHGYCLVDVWENGSLYSGGWHVEKICVIVIQEEFVNCLVMLQPDEFMLRQLHLQIRATFCIFLSPIIPKTLQSVKSSKTFWIYVHCT